MGQVEEESFRKDWSIFGIVAIIAIVVLVIVNASTGSTYNNGDITDSLARAKEDSATKFHIAEQNKVVDGIEFGISQKSFDQAIKKFNNKNRNKDEYANNFQIGEYYYLKAEGRFDNDSLYEVDFDGDMYLAENYYTVFRNELDVLYKTISTKYGKHTYGDGPPLMHDTEKNKSYLAYSWSIGTKQIYVKIKCHGSFYSADLEIFRPAVIDKLVKKDITASDSTAKKASDAL